MESPNKPPKQSSLEPSADYVPLGLDSDDANNQYGYGTTNGFAENQSHDRISHAPPRGPRAMYQHQSRPQGNRNAWNDPRNAKDRPKSKHALPGYEPWVLVKTKLGRRFVHNTLTRESFWRVPADVMPGVRDFDQWESEETEKKANAEWAEEQLKDMRRERTRNSAEINNAADMDGRSRRRRSESLQREDEEAVLAELAAEEEKDFKEVVGAVGQKQGRIVHRGDPGNESESSYEEVEVTDSEFEEEDEQEAQSMRRATDGGETEQLGGYEDGGAVEFGEDDIAYQLAAMEQDLRSLSEDAGSDHDSQANGEADGWNPQGDEEEDPRFPESEFPTTLFCTMLNDHNISPFIPWDTLISDSSETGIIMDPRYTALPNMRTRKAVWEGWVKDTAARLKAERAAMKEEDPRVPYLAFLAEKASPKLYWPEFKRKFKKEAVMNERKLGEKERERLYREHINRLKLPESARKADLITLLNALPLRSLNKETRLDALPQQLLTHLHYISLPVPVRDEVVTRHISTLPSPPSSGGEQEDGEFTEDQQAEEDKKRAARRKREEALQAREREVDEAKRRAGKEERWAKRELKEGEREVEKATLMHR